MKKSSRILSFLLALIFSVSLCSVCAAAEIPVEPELSSYGEGFLAIGDSYVRGMGSSDNWDSIYYMDNLPGNLTWTYRATTRATVNCRNVEGAFTYRIAQAIGCCTPEDITDQSGTYWPLAQNGLTLNAVMDLIGYDDGYFDSDYSHNTSIIGTRYDANLYYYGSPGKSVSADGGVYTGEAGHAGDLNELISRSKLIVSALGMGDVFNRSYQLIRLSPNYDLSDPQKYSALLRDVIEIAEEGYDYWETYYPVFLNHLKQSSDATIVVVSTVNPIFNLTLSDSTLAPLGTAFSAMTVRMNNAMKQWCDELGLLYVDISNVETGITQYSISFKGDFDNDRSFADHPTKEGHEQIARMILDALKEYDGISDTPSKDIRVDIGRFDKLDYVHVNGILTEDYDFDGHFLTVHCKTSLVSSLTIGAELNGRQAVTVYHVVHDSDGYTAYRTYTSNNAWWAAGNIIASVKKSLSSIFARAY